MKILVLGNAQRPGVRAEVERWLPWLRSQAEVVAVDLCQEADLAALAPTDVALVFGGDGAILRAARQMAYRQIPVLGINLGRLGFLADIHPDDFQRSFQEVAQGNYGVTRHLMFECLVEGDSQPPPPLPPLHKGGPGNPFPPLDKGGPGGVLLGLNEVVVHALPPFHILDLELEIDGLPVARFSGDGLIISSPIGSTAHNLSAGGPILAQELSAFVVTPICAHTLTYRPIVESAEKVHVVRLGQGARQAAVIVDGQEAAPLGPGQRVVIRMAPVSFSLVKVPGRSYYQTLRDKLRWGLQPGKPIEP